jgi:hypothetical protein
MAAYSIVRPVSPLKNTACREERTVIDDHSVALRSRSPRPEKCWDGPAVTVSCDALRTNAPGFEMRPDAERRNEWHVELGERVDRRVIEVIVVIVRHDD